MTKTLSAVLIMLCAVSCIHVGNNGNLSAKKRVTAKGPYTTRATEYVSNFSAIESRGVADVEFSQVSGRPSITVSGAENVLQYLIVEVRGNVLDISIDKNVDIAGEHRLKVVVTGGELYKMNTIGTGDIKVLGELTTADLELITRGTGDIELRDIVASGNVSMDIVGTGDIEFDKLMASGGKVDIGIKGTGDVSFIDIVAGRNATITVSGTGDVDGGSLHCVSSKFVSSGTSDIEIDDLQATELDLVVSGTGDADIAGSTDRFQATLSGTGDIDAGRLIAQSVTAKLSGLGTIYCHAEDELYAHVSSLGRVVYSGNPETVEITGNQKRVSRSGE